MKDDNAYNFRVIDYGDSVQVRLYSTPVLRGGQVSKLDRLHLHDVSDDEFDELLEQKRQERSINSSVNRTKNSIYSVARANEWEFFVTLTFDRSKVDSSDYNLISSKSRTWLNHLKARYASDLKYLAVPELHTDGKHWHIHALLSNIGSIKLEDSGIVKAGKKIYNLPGWNYGFSTASMIESSERVSSYICKYITKELATLTQHRKRFWSSANCVRFKDCVSDEFLDDPGLIFEKYGDSIDYIKKVKCPVVNRSVTYVEISKEVKTEKL